MPTTKLDMDSLTNQEKLELIEQIETGMVPGASDNDDKMKQIGDLWESVCQSNPVFDVPDWLKEQLVRDHEEYLRDPSQAKSWEEVKAWILDRHARTKNPA